MPERVLWRSRCCSWRGSGRCAVRAAAVRGWPPAFGICRGDSRRARAAQLSRRRARSRRSPACSDLCSTAGSVERPTTAAAQHTRQPPRDESYAAAAGGTVCAECEHPPLSFLTRLCVLSASRADVLLDLGSMQELDWRVPQMVMPMAPQPGVMQQAAAAGHAPPPAPQ